MSLKNQSVVNMFCTDLIINKLFKVVINKNRDKM